jgi:excisionase family DNA binding protein
MEYIRVPETVSIPEACCLLNVSRRTIYNWKKADKIKFVRAASGRMRIITTSLYRDGNIPVAKP